MNTYEENIIEKLESSEKLENESSSGLQYVTKPLDKNLKNRKDLENLQARASAVSNEELCERIQKGDKEAEELILVKNQALVDRIVLKYQAYYGNMSSESPIVWQNLSTDEDNPDDMPSGWTPKDGYTGIDNENPEDKDSETDSEDDSSTEEVDNDSEGKHESRELYRNIRINEDLESVGLIALWEASKKFNPDKGVHFSTFAYNEIRNSVLDEIRKHGHAVSIPEREYEKYNNYQKRYKQLMITGISEAKIIETIAEEFAVTCQDVIRCIEKVTMFQSYDYLSKPVYSDNDEEELISKCTLDQIGYIGGYLEEMPALKNYPVFDDVKEKIDIINNLDLPYLLGTEKVAMSRLFHKSLIEKINSLLPRYQNILKLRYGLWRFDPMSQDQVAKLLEIPLNRVRTFEDEAIKRLKEMDDDGDLKDLYLMYYKNQTNGRKVMSDYDSTMVKFCEELKNYRKTPNAEGYSSYKKLMADDLYCLLYCLALKGGKVNEEQQRIIEKLSSFGPVSKEFKQLSDKEKNGLYGYFCNGTPFFDELLQIEENNGIKDNKFTRLYLSIIENGGRLIVSSAQKPEIVQKNLTVFKAVLSNRIKNCVKVSTKSKETVKGSEVKKDPKVLNDYLDELDSLIGLTSVKKRVKTEIETKKLEKIRIERGLDIEKRTLHMIFKGNPGTGKTTIARLIGQIYKELGVLPTGRIKEVDRSGLVAQYTGQTEAKTQKVISDAMGGILFIDEAYALSRGNESDGSIDYGIEAIDVLVKQMEDKKDKFMVIAAGYPEEMDKFLDANPGLKSRFSTTIEFEDYDAKELRQIFKLLCKKGYEPSEEALKLVEDFYNEYLKSNKKNFGNGRDVRNLFDKTIEAQTMRLANSGNVDALSNNELKEITKEDVKEGIFSQYKKICLKREDGSINLVGK